MMGVKEGENLPEKADSEEEEEKEEQGWDKSCQNEPASLVQDLTMKHIE